MMKIVAAALAAVCVTAFHVKPPDAVDFQQIVTLSSQENAEEAIKKALQSVSCETLQRSWGEPDGMLSGFWGDIWELDEERKIIVYYNAEGRVEEVRISVKNSS